MIRDEQCGQQVVISRNEEHHNGAQKQEHNTPVSWPNNTVAIGQVKVYAGYVQTSGTTFEMMAY